MCSRFTCVTCVKDHRYYFDVFVTPKNHLNGMLSAQCTLAEFYSMFEQEYSFANIIENRRASNSSQATTNLAGISIKLIRNGFKNILKASKNRCRRLTGELKTHKTMNNKPLVDKVIDALTTYDFSNHLVNHLKTEMKDEYKMVQDIFDPNTLDNTLEDDQVLTDDEDDEDDYEDDERFEDGGPPDLYMFNKIFRVANFEFKFQIFIENFFGMKSGDKKINISSMNPDKNLLKMGKRKSFSIETNEMHSVIDIITTLYMRYTDTRCYHLEYLFNISSDNDWIAIYKNKCIYN